MLWDRVQQFKQIFSLVFCFGFSISSLIWNGNYAAKTIAGSNRFTFSISSTFNSIGGFFKGFSSRFRSNEELRLEKEAYQKLVEEYKVLPHDIELLRSENNSLRKELGYEPKTTNRTLKSEVLSIRLNSIYRTIIIDKGKADGVQPYMPVVARAISDSGEVITALVGKVIAVENSTSVVQPIINSNFSMGVQIPSTNLWLVLSGNSNKGTWLMLNYIDSGVIVNPRISGQIGPLVPEEVNQDIGILGKAVYSSSGGGLFPASIPVGIIVEEGPRSGSFKTAYVKPYIKFEELQYVSVILKLPDKWREMWPEEKSVLIENPFYGDLNFPNEKDDPKALEKETVKPVQNPQVINTIKKPKQPSSSPVQETTKKAQILDESEAELLRRLETP